MVQHHDGREIINLTETDFKVLPDGKIKIYPKIGDLVMVNMLNGYSNRMEIIVTGKNYLVCDNRSGIEVSCVFRIHNTPDFYQLAIWETNG